MDTRIAYFAGCTANYIEPEVGMAVIQILEKNGLHTVFPDQSCCAVPQHFYGDLRSFFLHAESNVRSLLKADCDIVTACTSCAMAIKRDYPKMLQTQEAKIVATRTYDIMEYLVKLSRFGRLNKEFQPINNKLAYHAPCHLKALGQDLIIKRLALLRIIPGLTVTQVNRGCCGMAGTFGVKKSNYALSMDIGKPLFDEIKRLKHKGSGRLIAQFEVMQCYAFDKLKMYHDSIGDKCEDYLPIAAHTYDLIYANSIFTFTDKSEVDPPNLAGSGIATPSIAKPMLYVLLSIMRYLLQRYKG